MVGRFSGGQRAAVDITAGVRAAVATYGEQHSHLLSDGDDLVGYGRRKVGFLGDSITIGSDAYEPTMIGQVNHSKSAPMWSMLLSERGSWEFVINAGVSGENSTEILSRLQADVIDNGCDICVIFSCTWNDIEDAFTVAASVANVTEMITRCIGANVLPVLCTPTPDGTLGTTAARKNAAAQRRRRFIGLGQEYNIPVVDLMPVIIDATTGNISSTYLSGTGDVHPNQAGARVLGQTVAAVLDRICPGDARGVVTYAGDTDDLLTGFGFHLADTNADGVANGWTVGGVAATYTIPTDATLGKVQRITTSGTVGNAQVSRSVTFTAGHVYEISAYMTKTGTSSAQISLTGATDQRKITIDGADADTTRGKVSLRFIPADTAVTLFLLAGAGTGFCEFGRLGIRDLTALGLT